MTDSFSLDERPPDENADPVRSAERCERLKRIRREIEDGGYDTEGRMDKALLRMLKRLEDDTD